MSRWVPLIPYTVKLFSRAAPGPRWLVSLYIKETVPMSPFHVRTDGPISTKFCTDLHTNLGKVLNTIMIPTSGPQGTPNSKTQMGQGRETWCNVKCPDGSHLLIKFFLGSAGARLASLLSSIYIKQTVCTYVPLSHLLMADQSPPNFAHTSTPTQ